MEGGWDILWGRAGPSYTGPAVVSRRAPLVPAPASPCLPRLPRFPRLPSAAGLWDRDGAGAAACEVGGRGERGVCGAKPRLTPGPAQLGVRKEERADGAVPPPSGFRPPSRDPPGQARSLRAAVPELGSRRGHIGAETPPCPAPCSPAQCRLLPPLLSLLHRPQASQPPTGRAKAAWGACPSRPSCRLPVLGGGGGSPPKAPVSPQPRSPGLVGG